MGSTLHNVLLHIVFSTKHRRRHIVPELQPRLYEYIGGTIRSLKCVLYGAGGTDDHLHLLVRWHTTVEIADLVQEVQGGSSRWVYKTFPQWGDFQWQEGYAAFSVSQSQCGFLSRYIQSQEQHHRKMSFQDELRELLRKHEIEYDERYLWD